MQRFTDKYYEGRVVNNDVDPNHAGAVRVMIIGITDSLPDKDQPFAIPALNLLTGVPTAGTYLEIVFDEGDIHKPKYFGESSEQTYLPKDYVDEYPNVAIGNLGGDFFSMRHDRKNKDTLIQHPSESDILWDSFGRISHDSDNAYDENSDQAGTANEAIGGSRILPVLTQGTVDIFTCRVFGAGEIAMQGSEYLFTAHMSKDTVNRIKNEVTASSIVEDEEDNPDVKPDPSEYRPLLDGQVLWEKAPKPGKDRLIKDINTVVVTSSGGDSFLRATQIIGLSKDVKETTQSVHYIIGKSAHNASTNGANVSSGEETNISSGFVQTVELNQEASWFSSAIKSDNNKSIHNNSIVILAICKDLKDLTAYQTENINNIIKHVENLVKAETKVQSVKITRKDI